MSTSRRRIARRRKRVLAKLPPRYVNGTPLPPELNMLVPEDDPYTYVNSRDRLHDVALIAMRAVTPIRHTALICDVVGGVHAVRCFERDRGLSLLDVADIVRAELCDAPLPMAMIYLERGTCLPMDAEARWDELLGMHRASPFLVDALVVSPEDQLVWSHAECFGPNPWSSEIAERCRFDVQAAEIRQKLGLDG